MKKILVIAPYPYLPYYSGGQKFIAQFLEYLGKKTALTVVSGKKNDASLAGTYTLLPILERSFSRYLDFRLVRQISDLVIKENIDEVIWEHPYYAWLAFRVRKNTGVSTIIHSHNIEHQRFRSTGRWWWPVLRKYEKWALRKADKVLFITDEDRSFAVNEWKLSPETCSILPFGITLNKNPTDRKNCREILLHRHDIPAEEKILLFNGLLDYKPNLDALMVILKEINPFLLNTPGFKYRIIICGKRLPDSLNQLKAYRDQHISFAGFVPDIETYFKGADVFLNPVISGGGVKTKMVEAIAYGTTVVSTVSGAAGMEAGTCGNKLQVTGDSDWKAFSERIVVAAAKDERTPDAYYQYYYWENIIERMLSEH